MISGLGTVVTGSALPEATTRVYHKVDKIFCAFSLYEDEEESEHGETTPVAATARQRDESHVTIAIANGHGKGQFNNSNSMKALKKAYEKRGKSQRVKKDAWDKFKKTIKKKLREDAATELLKAITFSKDAITMDPLSTLEIIFVGFDKE